MKLGHTLFFVAGILLCSSCQENAGVNQAQTIVNQTIERHGGDSYDKLSVGFIFREKQYTIDLDGPRFSYTRAFQDSIGMYHDALSNDGFIRKIDGKATELSTKDSSAFSNSVNSVAYFTLLPRGLNDDAVNKEYLGRIQINEAPYHVIKVTFDQEGGGKDFEDEFRYWIHEENLTLDFLAYSYHTNEAGVRFRAVLDNQMVDGVRFQNYINYKPEDKETPLDELPGLFESGQLKELSRIINEDIQSL